MSVKGFNFLVNSFWVEIEEKIEQYIKSIFAPGDPVVFHKVRKIFRNANVISMLKIQKCTISILCQVINFRGIQLH